jgi:hypothetical protein
MRWFSITFSLKNVELQTSNSREMTGLRSFLVLVALAALGGCTSWRPQARSPQLVLPERRPPSVKLELQDGSLIVVTSPRVEESDLVGFGKPGGERVRLHLSQIRTLWIRELDKKKTGILAGTLAVVGTIAFIYREKLNLGLGYNGIF